MDYYAYSHLIRLEDIEGSKSEVLFFLTEREMKTKTRRTKLELRERWVVTHHGVLSVW